MTDSWEITAERAKKATSNDLFIKLDDDEDKVVGAFVGDPYARELFWNQAERKYEPHTAEHEKRGDKLTLKVSMNFYVIKEGNGEDLVELDPPKMKVLEVNATTYGAIMKARKKYGFDKCYFEIERSGAKGDTNTKYSVMPDEKFDDGEYEKICALNLNDLERATGGNDPASDDDYKKSKGKSGSKSASNDDGDDPIDKGDAQELVGVLKTIEREKLDEFLSKFGISKVKELRKKDLAGAKKWIDDVANGDGDEDEGEADPFS